MSDLTVVPSPERFAELAKQGNVVPVFVDFVADADEHAIIAGDANVRPGEGRTYEYLGRLGFSLPLLDSIDQIMVRGLDVTPPTAWPAERRSVRGRLLSDHAPVELTVR